MKKCLFVLISSGFLFAAERSGAAENPMVVSIAATMAGKTHWADFETSPEYDTVKGNMSLSHSASIKKTLEDAYEVWLPGYLAAHPAAAGAAFKVAVGGSKKAAAAAVMADADTVRGLAKGHKAALIAAMSVHSAANTAAEIARNADLKRQLATAHARELVQEGSMALIQEGSMSLMNHGPLQSHLRHIVLSHGASHADTAAEIARNADLKQELATTHRGPIVTEMGARDAAGAAAAIAGNAALRRHLAYTHANDLVQEGSFALLSAMDSPANRNEVVAKIVEKNDLRMAVIDKARSQGLAMSQEHFHSLILGADPTANGGQGDGLWHAIMTDDHADAKAKIQALGHISPADGSMPI